MKQLYCALVLLLPFIAVAQDEVLNPEERAYLFHIVKKSPILEENIGRYFDYQGPDIRFPNGNLNYDSVELVIINQPEVLTAFMKGMLEKVIHHHLFLVFLGVCC